VVAEPNITVRSCLIWLPTTITNPPLPSLRNRRRRCPQVRCWPRCLPLAVKSTVTACKLNRSLRDVFAVGADHHRDLANAVAVPWQRHAELGRRRQRHVLGRRGGFNWTSRRRQSGAGQRQRGVASLVGPGPARWWSASGP
jgi:hypothetical protein